MSKKAMMKLKGELLTLGSRLYCEGEPATGLCQAMELSPLYPIIKKARYCLALATDVIRVWDSDERKTNLLPVCRHHKEKWLQHYGGEFNDKGEIVPQDEIEGD